MRPVLKPYTSFIKPCLLRHFTAKQIYSSRLFSLGVLSMTPVVTKTNSAPAPADGQKPAHHNGQKITDGFTVSVFCEKANVNIMCSRDTWIEPMAVLHANWRIRLFQSIV